MPQNNFFQEILSGFQIEILRIVLCILFRHMIDYITNVYFDTYVYENGIVISAHAYHGTGVEVEYEMSLWDEEMDTYTVIREYNDENRFVYQPKQAGTYHICVKAREIGSDADYDRYYKKVVEY